MRMAALAPVFPPEPRELVRRRDAEMRGDRRDDHVAWLGKPYPDAGLLDHAGDLPLV